VADYGSSLATLEARGWQGSLRSRRASIARRKGHSLDPRRRHLGQRQPAITSAAASGKIPTSSRSKASNPADHPNALVESTLSPSNRTARSHRRFRPMEIRPIPPRHARSASAVSRSGRSGSAASYVPRPRRRRHGIASARSATRPASEIGDDCGKHDPDHRASHKGSTAGVAANGTINAQVSGVVRCVVGGWRQARMARPTACAIDSALNLKDNTGRHRDGGAGARDADNQLGALHRLSR